MPPPLEADRSGEPRGIRGVVLPRFPAGALSLANRHGARDTYLRERGVTLLGGGIDESPQAYKDIESVIAAQHDLVEVLGKFTPRIVRMADEPGDV